MASLLSLKTASRKFLRDIVGNYKNPDNGTIIALNNALTEKYKTQGSLLHLVSMNLLAVPFEFKSSVADASKLSVKFKFGAGYKTLPEHMQEQAWGIATDKAVLRVMADPFRVNSSSSNAHQDADDEIEESHDENDVSMDNIPF
jgi:hypothetical protein